MDFIDQLRALSSRIANTKDMIQTEEATKNAMVMPFIQILGYNVFDPLEVTPELIADIGTKKGERSTMPSCVTANRSCSSNARSAAPISTSITPASYFGTFMSRRPGSAC